MSQSQTQNYQPPTPVADAPPDATDKVYAHIIFEMAQGEGGKERLERLVDHCEQLQAFHSPELREFLRSRIIPVRDKERVLRKVFEGRIDPLLLRLFLLLNTKERLYRAGRVLTALIELFHERFGKVEVDVYTVEPLDQEQLQRVREALANSIRREIVLHPYQDKEMIGGIRLQLGDRLIDASIATQLRLIRERMMEEGSNAVMTRADRIIEEK